VATTDILKIRNFAQLAEADLAFGDLTVLVGAQGTGKSLALQRLKAAMDGRQIVEALRAAGHSTDKPQVLVDLIFGAGMGEAWQPNATEILFNGKKITPTGLGRVGEGRERVFFVPAHRAMLISDGWASPFQRLTSDTPVVARIFSQNLFDRFSARGEGPLFPLERVLKKEYRDQIDAAVFHGGSVAIEEDRQHAKRLRLAHGKMHLPFMTWTAGQREFTPLLLGLYHLLPARQLLKQPDIDWVVIEEPEMGLHPDAVTVVMLLVLDLLWRGYRVALLLGHAPSAEVVAVEPHSAKQDEVTTVIRKKRAALDQLKDHLRDGARMAKWLWVTSGKVHFADTEKTRRLLDEKGIEFVGTRVYAKHLPLAAAPANQRPHAARKRRRGARR
jgi:hypothetical protein